MFFENITIDNILFGFRDGELEILLVDFKKAILDFLLAKEGHLEIELDESMKFLIDFHLDRAKPTDFQSYTLPGGHLHRDRNPEHEAQLIIDNFIGGNRKKQVLKQLGVFGDTNRVPYTRILTIAYYTLLNPKNFELNKVKMPDVNISWHKISKLPKELNFDQKKIIEEAIRQLREDIKIKPIGFNLLEDKFTIRELQTLYECILDTKLDSRNFRKKILNMDFLNDTEEMQKKVSHRAAKLYKFNKRKYDKLTKEGFDFRF
jgi:8-oxo-dGTP diphosphatase